MLAVASALLLALAASTPAVARAQSATLPPADAPDEYVHTIVRGDTLVGIGNALLTRPLDWPALQRLNRIRNPRRLRPGAPLRIPINLLRNIPGRADVDWVKGRVHTRRGGGAGLLALVGASLEPGTTLITEADAAVRLRLTGGAVVTVGELAHVTLVDLRQFPAANSSRTLIGLQRGRLQQGVPPRRAPGQRHEIRTPVVTTAVRGTEFRVGVGESGRSAVTEVLDGDVAVGRAADVVDVAAGFGTVARQGEPLAAPRPLLPAPLLGNVATGFNRLPVRFQWTPLPGASRYRAVVFPAATDQPFATQIVDVPDVDWPDLPDGSYVLALRGIERDGLEGLDATFAFSVEARPEPPIAMGPVVDAVLFGDRADLEWTRPEGVSAFDVQVARDTSFAAPVFERVGHQGLLLSAPLPAGPLVWRVASRVGDARGPWGDPTAFTLRPVPPGGPPAGLGALDESRLTLRWAAGRAGDRYRVQFARDAAFTDMLADQTVEDPSLQLPRPAPGEYFVRVGIIEADGTEGAFGSMQSLAIPKQRRSRWWWLLAPIGVVGALVAVS